MSVSQNFPNIAPSLSLDFANVKALDSRVTFTRASSARYYNGVTTTKAEQNLVLQSQTFDNASWTKTNATITADATTAPDGSTTADALVETATTSSHLILQSVSGVIATDYIASVYAKASNRNFLSIGFDGLNAWFNLSTGAVATVEAGLTGSIASVGNGWYRCSVKRTVVTAANKTFAIYAVSADNSVSYAGDASSTAIFIWGAQLEQRSTVTAYTPTTTQPITNYIPTLLTATDNVARFDHNPTTGESLGLLIEEQRTNLLTYSEQFDNAAWSKFEVTVAANVVVAPDGTLTAEKLIGSSANNTHRVFRSLGSAAAHTLSAFLKAGEYTWGVVRLDGVSTFFNLSTGTVGTSGSGNTASITSVGNGWYRCSVTRTLVSSTASAIGLATADNTETFAGDGYSGIFIWGAQLEAGAFPTSYIPTVESQVTRSADAASMTGANFSSWYRQDEGTFSINAKSPNVAGVYYYLVASSDASNEIRLASQSAGSNPNFAVTVAGVIQASINVANAAGSPFISAFAYETNSFNLATNATLGTEDTAGILPTTTQLSIGARSNGTAIINGTIKKLAFYPTRLTNAQLQALTS